MGVLASFNLCFISLEAVGYYMAVHTSAGLKKDIGRLKLLLRDLQPQSNFCMLFNYRLSGDKVGKLRVFVKNRNNAAAWEETRSDDRWKMGKIQLHQGIDTTKSVSGGERIELSICILFQQLTKAKPLLKQLSAEGPKMNRFFSLYLKNWHSAVSTQVINLQQEKYRRLEL